MQAAATAPPGGCHEVTTRVRQDTGVTESADVFVVAGMHRSATSAVSSFLLELGIDMGADLIGPDRTNPNGFFEDSSMVAFSRRLLDACAEAGQTTPGHPDWGWGADGLVDGRVPDVMREEAIALTTARGATGTAWGWKDPRNSLFLDFWADVLPQARFVLVYRDPWDVQDSMQRLGYGPFLEHPAWGHAIWSQYNERLLSFTERHRDRTVLVHTPTLLADADPVGRLARLLEGKESVARGSDPDPHTPAVPPHPGQLVVRARTSAIAKLHAALWPDEVELLARLDELADLPGPVLPEGEPVPSDRDDARKPVTISVVVTVHDDGPFLAESLASAADSLPEDHEVIVMDDGSSDPETLRIPDRLTQIGYRVIHQEHAGLGAARNRGFSAARGEFVIPLDADNRLRPEFLTDALHALRADDQLGAVYGNRRLFGLTDGWDRPGEFDATRIIDGNYIDACAVIRCTAWLSSGGYDEELRLYEDWEFWLAQHHQGWEMLHLDIPMIDYRVRPNSMLRRPSTQTAIPRAQETIQQRYSQLHRTALIGHLAAADTAVQEARVQAGTALDHAEELQRRNGELEQELARSRWAFDSTVHGYESSLSWRLTKPLRWTKRSLQRVVPRDFRTGSRRAPGRLWGPRARQAPAAPTSLGR